MTTRPGWTLEVRLRGVSYPLVYAMADEAAARAAALWFATTYMRKCPQDRSGAWLITKASQVLTMDESGVGSSQQYVVLAVLDPREVSAVSVDYVPPEVAS